MTDRRAEARALSTDGDVPGLLRHLRTHGAELPLRDIANLVGEAVKLSGFDDLVRVATAVVESRDPAPDTQALFDFGYACVERGLAHLAIDPPARCPVFASSDRSRPAVHLGWHIC